MQLPVVDIVEVGPAAVRSPVRCDRRLHVGPQSAGADPGPAAYGMGSQDPVVTDADFILGRINGERFLNGAMRLDRAAAERAVGQKVAGPLRLGVTEGALGIVQIADAAMSLAVRAVSINKGVDPRQCAMIAFGGQGRCTRSRSRARFSSQKWLCESAGHILGARHVDGAVAAGFRAHSLWHAGAASMPIPSRRCLPNSPQLPATWSVVTACGR